jgi:carbon storage regulator
MLVLTRRPGEEIILDGVIRLIVVSVKGDRIRLGIDAPPSVVVDRQEIHERRQHSPDSVAEPCCVMGSAEKESTEQLLAPMLR